MVGTVEIIVAKDMMSASLRFIEEGTTEITEQGIMKQLEEIGISKGIRVDIIQACLQSNSYGKEYIVAEGKRATAGTDGRYEYMFSTEKKEYKPQIREDGSVDYSVHRELVKEGDLVAVYHPAKQGFFGYTIFSTVVAPVPAKDLPQLHVTGVERKDNNYYAKVDGEISLVYDSLVVKDVLTIEGSATNVTGKIEYTGNIHVMGDIVAGVEMVAGGSISVDGVIEGAHVKAGKNIVVKRGVHGQQKAVIEAGESVFAPFVEEAHIVAGEDVVYNTLYCSQVEAGRDVKIDGRVGSILGGKTYAGGRIQARILGNDSQINTLVAIKEKPLEDGGEPEVDPRSCVVIEDKAFGGVKLAFGKLLYNGLITAGEYHSVYGQMGRYDIGNFSYTPRKKKKLEQKDDKPVILLVDDEPMILKTFFSYLAKDYKVMAANSAKDAFGIMERIVPDLILLDYQMPNMNGGEMLEEMRKRSWKGYANVPVMFATAVTDRSVVQKCLSLYPQGYLIKPLGQEELLGVVKKFFENRTEEMQGISH